MTDKAPYDGRTGTCKWVDGELGKDLVLRDIPATKELVIEVWASDASEEERGDWGGRARGQA